MFVFRAAPEKGKLLAALYILCNPVIERLGQGCQIPVSHVAVKGALLGEPGFFQCGQDVTEGGQTGDLVLTERSQLEFGGVGDPLRHMEQAGNLLIGIRTELGILWAVLFFCNFHQTNQSSLKLRGALQDPVFPEPLGVFPFFLLGVEGGQLFLFIDAGGRDRVDEFLRPGKVLPVMVS